MRAKEGTKNSWQRDFLLKKLFFFFKKKMRNKRNTKIRGRDKKHPA
jgi:hypothetical protein